MLGKSTRILQRYLVPRWAASLYYLLRCRVLVSPLAKVQVTRAISFGRGTVVKPFAVVQTHRGRIAFGRQCAVSSFDHISTGDGDVLFGDYVRLAPHVTIVGGTKQFQRRDVPILFQEVDERQGVLFGDDVLVGAGAVVLPGCNVGRGAVIGAGSVVAEDIAEYAIVAGVPAKVVGERK